MKTQINKISAVSDNSRLGRMLGAGRVTATLKSKKSGEHITMTLKCSVKKDERWKQVPLEEASHVYISQGSGSGWNSPKVGTYYPQSGLLYLNRGFETPVWEYAVKHVLYAAVTGTLDTELHEIHESNNCGHCGRELTDPVSIERGLGPECYGQMTGSVHYRKQEVKATPDDPYDYAPGHKPSLPSMRLDRKGRDIPRTFEALAALAPKK